MGLKSDYFFLERGEQFLCGGNRTAGGGSIKQKSFMDEKGWQPKGSKSCSWL